MSIDTLCSEVESDPTRADAWWTLANELSRAGRSAEAAKAWQKLGELPHAHHRGPAFYNAGNEHLRSRAPSLALEMYDRAVDQDFEDVSAVVYNVALALADTRGRTSATEQDRRDAQARVEPRLKHAAQWGDFAAFLENYAGDRSGAARAYQRAIELDADANGGEWWINLAENLLAIGDLEGAISAWEKGRAMDHPGFPQVERALASKRGEAEKLLERWNAESAPRMIGQRLALLFDMQRNEDATRFAQERLAAPATEDVDRIVLLLELARNALRQRDPIEALGHLAALPGSPNAAASLRARALCDARRFDDALQLLEPSSKLGALAPVEDRLLLAKCRAAKGLPVDTSFLGEVNPLPEWWSQ